MRVFTTIMLFLAFSVTVSAVECSDPDSAEQMAKMPLAKVMSAMAYFTGQVQKGFQDLDDNEKDPETLKYIASQLKQLRCYQVWGLQKRPAFDSELSPRQSEQCIMVFQEYLSATLNTVVRIEIATRKALNELESEDPKIDPNIPEYRQTFANLFTSLEKQISRGHSTVRDTNGLACISPSDDTDHWDRGY